ncbi:hypothetical protein HMPREF9103_01279, partial [Lentilactobacillus parafarraginis F0439]
LRREIEDLKFQRDKQLATKDQQISSKDRQIEHLTKLIDQQQQLQLATVAESKKLSSLCENPNAFKNPQDGQPKEDIHKNKSRKCWWHFW